MACGEATWHNHPSGVRRSTQIVLRETKYLSSKDIGRGSSHSSGADNLVIRTSVHPFSKTLVGASDFSHTWLDAEVNKNTIIAFKALWEARQRPEVLNNRADVKY